MGLRPFRVLSLCSGVGGLDRGLRLAVPSARTICYIEREAYCCEVLASRMEEGRLDPAPVWSNLRTFDGLPWSGIVDCVLGGIPCQPASVAGRQRGSDDERWLWPDAIRVVSETSPDWCFFENVPGILSGRVLPAFWRDVIGPLGEMGYRLAGGLFTAEEAGATQKRERFFLLACRDGSRQSCYGQQDCWPQPGLEEGPLRNYAGRRGSSLVESSSERRGKGRPEHVLWGRWCSIAGPGGRLFPPGPEDLEAWEQVLVTNPELAPAIEPSVHGLADGLASRVDRIRAGGNGVVPVQAKLAWETLYPCLANKGDNIE